MCMLEHEVLADKPTSRQRDVSLPLSDTELAWSLEAGMKGQVQALCPVVSQLDAKD